MGPAFKTYGAAFTKGPFFLSMARLAFALFWLTFPFQVRTLLFDLPLHASGNFNPYTTFFLSFSDILLAITACFFGVALAREEVSLRLLSGAAKWFFTLLLAFAGSLLLTALLATEPLLVLFSSLRFFEWTFLAWLLVQGVLPVSRVALYFLAGLLVQSVLALGQTLWQGSFLRGGFFDGLGSLLGEPLLGASAAGAAKIDVGTVKILRAYGTFPHPNILAGALGMALFFLQGSRKIFTEIVPGFGRKAATAYSGQVKWYKWQAWRFPMRVLVPICAGIFIAGFLLTFSRAAVLALLIGFLGYLVFSGLLWRNWKRVLLVFGMGLVFLVGTFFASDVFRERFAGLDDPDSLAQRVMYLGAAGDMFLARPFGVGLSHFTLALPDFVNSALPPWEFQPVHNIYVLAFAEGGILSGALFLALWCFVFIVLLVRLLYDFLLGSVASKSALKVQQKDRFWAASLLGCGTFLMIIGLFDHYLFTLPQGQVLLYLYFGLVAALLAGKNGEK